MATTTPDPVLDISTIVERPTIRIDGEIYQLRSSDELPWLVYRGYAETFRRSAELLQVEARDEAQEQELEALLPPLTEAMVLAPKTVLARLSTDQRYAILSVFSALLVQTPQRPGATRRRAARVRRGTATKRRNP